MAETENVAGCPSVMVWLIGWVVTDGAIALTLLPPEVLTALLPPEVLEAPPPPPPQLRKIAHSRRRLAAGTSFVHSWPGRPETEKGLLALNITSTQASSRITIIAAGDRQSGSLNFPGASRLDAAPGATEHVVEPRVEETVQLKDGVPEKPFSGVSSNCAVPQEPFFNVSCVGEKASEKSTDEVAFPVPAAVTEVQFVTISNASIDPKPVAKSYPIEY